MTTLEEHAISLGLKPYYFQYMAAHGILMFAAWGILVPSGIYIARYKRQTGVFGYKWFTFHSWIMYAVLVCAATAAVFGFLACKTHFNLPHKIIAVVILATLGAQVLLGFFAHLWRDPTRLHRPLVNKLHRWIGLFALAPLAVANMSIGLFDHVDMRIGIKIAFFVYAFIVAALFMSAECDLNRHRSMRPRVIKSKPADLDSIVEEQ